MRVTDNFWKLYRENYRKIEPSFERRIMLNYPASGFVTNDEIDSDDLRIEMINNDISFKGKEISSIDPSFTKGLVFALPASLCLWAGIAFAIHTIF